ncbi:hypothetical protein UCRPC4_g01555 [Phaeomoniella chlamydospora]|uniref:Uncharacterized protein n=1 Tax=Phaeomoniella chlamydospora TaxID=158046 RepID=A0A0G2HCL1_PHACM|nr:hypothetical protein UCRPC4_g01555 [Phaeomoniella chlamydospora]
MSSAVFVSPLPISELTKSTRRFGSNGSAKKRKRTLFTKADRDEAPSDDASDSDGPSGPSRQRSMSSQNRQLILTPDDIYQYSVAGQPLDQELPGHNFPHSSGPKSGPAELEIERPVLSSLESKESLRSQHLAVITAILHRCILERDWDRAERALSLMLWSDSGGKGHMGHIDIRTHGRWGIGAELLLRKGRNQRGRSSSSRFSRTGFELAKQYYQTLIVQHPFYKHKPRSTDERSFNLALFDFWIFVAHQDGKRIRDGEDNEEMDYYAKRQLGLQQELEEARQIASSMDNLMISPLYSQHVEFIKLRAMVALWVADLSRELDAVVEDIANVEQPIGMDTNEPENGDAADSVYAGFLDSDEGHYGAKEPQRNIEAEESQMKANELFASLRARLGSPDESDDD